MFISIIIPVYNSELYLSECLDSISKQASKDFEVLLVDDCSTDNSIKICEDYCQNDDRFKLIKRSTNGGTSAARNTGLMQASGSYITFADNDDWWRTDCPHIIERLHETARNCKQPDVICCNTSSYWPRSQSFSTNSVPDEIVQMSGKRLINGPEALIKNGIYYAAVWSKVVKRDLIIQNELFFKEGKRNEDNDWSLRLLYHASSFVWHGDNFYVWRRNTENSQSAQNISSSVLHDLSLILRDHADYAFKRNGSSEMKIKCANNYAAYLYVIALSYLSIANCSTSQDRKVIEESKSILKSLNWLLDYDWNKRVHLVRLAQKLMGIEMTTKLLGMAMRKEKRRVRTR